MDECGSILAEWEDPERDEFKFCVCCVRGPGGELFGEVHEVMSAAPCVFRDLEEDLVCERRGEVCQRQSGNRTKHSNYEDM